MNRYTDIEQNKIVIKSNRILIHSMSVHPQCSYIQHCLKEKKKKERREGEEKGKEELTCLCDQHSIWQPPETPTLYMRLATVELWILQTYTILFFATG